MAEGHQIRLGMQVRSSDEENLGKVVRLDAADFVIEKGFFFPKDYRVRYDEVAAIRDGEVILKHGRDQLRAGYTSAEASAPSTAAPVSAAEVDVPQDKGEIRVPLVEEELRVEKRMEKVGEVRIHKEVVTEEKQVTVPVSREVVHVEHVPASGEGASASGSMFQEQSISVPVHEERVEIEKHPVVKEEVRISKGVIQGEETAESTVRREQAEVRAIGELEVEEAPPASERVPRAGVEVEEEAPKATGTGGRRG